MTKWLAGWLALTVILAFAGDTSLAELAAAFAGTIAISATVIAGPAALRAIGFGPGSGPGSTGNS